MLAKNIRFTFSMERYFFKLARCVPDCQYSSCGASGWTLNSDIAASLFSFFVTDQYLYKHVKDNHQLISIVVPGVPRVINSSILNTMSVHWRDKCIGLVTIKLFLFTNDCFCEDHFSSIFYVIPSLIIITTQEVHIF